MKFVARHREREIPVEVERHGSGYQLTMNGEKFLVDLVQAGASLHALRFPDGRQYLFLHRGEGSDYRISIEGRKVHLSIHDPLTMRRLRRDDDAGGDATIRAIMPGRVVRILVAAGESVLKGKGLLILEAMKMENEIVAPRDGTVALVHVESGATVENGAPLLTLELGDSA